MVNIDGTTKETETDLAQVSTSGPVQFSKEGIGVLPQKAKKIIIVKEAAEEYLEKALNDLVSYLFADKNNVVQKTMLDLISMIKYFKSLNAFSQEAERILAPYRKFYQHYMEEYKKIDNPTEIPFFSERTEKNVWSEIEKIYKLINEKKAAVFVDRKTKKVTINVREGVSIAEEVEGVILEDLDIKKALLKITSEEKFGIYEFYESIVDRKIHAIQLLSSTDSHTLKKKKEYELEKKLLPRLKKAASSVAEEISKLRYEITDIALNIKANYTKDIPIYFRYDFRVLYNFLKQKYLKSDRSGTKRLIITPEVFDYTQFIPDIGYSVVVKGDVPINAMIWLGRSSLSVEGHIYGEVYVHNGFVKLQYYDENDQLIRCFICQNKQHCQTDIEKELWHKTRVKRDHEKISREGKKAKENFLELPKEFHKFLDPEGRDTIILPTSYYQAKKEVKLISYGRYEIDCSNVPKNQGNLIIKVDNYKLLSFKWKFMGKIEIIELPDNYMGYYEPIRPCIIEQRCATRRPYDEKKDGPQVEKGGNVLTLCSGDMESRLEESGAFELPDSHLSNVKSEERREKRERRGCYIT